MRDSSSSAWLWSSNRGCPSPTLWTKPCSIRPEWWTRAIFAGPASRSGSQLLYREPRYRLPPIEHLLGSIVGGPDGGAFVTAPDMARFWESLAGGRLLDAQHTIDVTRDHVHAPAEGVDVHYGHGVWLKKLAGGNWRWFVMGYDPGVVFASARYPHLGVSITIARNTDHSCGSLLADLEAALGLI